MCYTPYNTRPKWLVWEFRGHHESELCTFYIEGREINKNHSTKMLCFLQNKKLPLLKQPKYLLKLLYGLLLHVLCVENIVVSFRSFTHASKVSNMHPNRSSHGNDFVLPG